MRCFLCFYDNRVCLVQGKGNGNDFSGLPKMNKPADVQQAYSLFSAQDETRTHTP